ncbi:hypothetical protein HJG60_011100 [Phyllostomus discolor]|uniref:Uncharacterized protein n=1 Tax=Phyllostomus discolor TaxID=89673 RepID=A0A834E500_9CHIR|nr:hypothetical protein HJG60_011100 [Phyllostomus discolor]
MRSPPPPPQEDVPGEAAEARAGCQPKRWVFARDLSRAQGQEGGSHAEPRGTRRRLSCGLRGPELLLCRRRDAAPKTREVLCRPPGASADTVGLRPSSQSPAQAPSASAPTGPLLWLNLGASWHCDGDGQLLTDWSDTRFLFSF